jgi:hypothetical protein
MATQKQETAAECGAQIARSKILWDWGQFLAALAQQNLMEHTSGDLCAR